MEEKLCGKVLKKIKQNVKGNPDFLLMEEKQEQQKIRELFLVRTLAETLVSEKRLGATAANLFVTLFGVGNCGPQATLAYLLLINSGQLKPGQVNYLYFSNPEDNTKTHSMCFIQSGDFDPDYFKSLPSIQFPHKDITKLKAVFVSCFAKGIILDPLFNFSGNPEQIPNEILNYFKKNKLDQVKCLNSGALTSKDVQKLYDGVAVVAKQAKSILPSTLNLATFDLLKLDLLEEKRSKETNSLEMFQGIMTSGSEIKRKQSEQSPTELKTTSPDNSTTTPSSKPELKPLLQKYGLTDSSSAQLEIGVRKAMTKNPKKAGVDVSSLLKAKANVNAKDPTTGETVLHLAAKKNSRPWVKFLLKHGASNSIQDNSGKKPNEHATNTEVQSLLTKTMP